MFTLLNHPQSAFQNQSLQLKKKKEKNHELEFYLKTLCYATKIMLQKCNILWLRLDMQLKTKHNADKQ